MEALQFIFSSFWVFIGCVWLLVTVFRGIALLISALRGEE